MIDTAVKTCSKCKRTRASEEFAKRPIYADGLDCWCRECHRQYRAKWNREHPERRKENSALYYLRHSDRQKAYRVKYLVEHPEVVKKTQAKYRLNHIEKTRAAVAKWAREHPEVIAAIQSRRRARKRGNRVGDAQSIREFREHIYSTPRIRCYYCRAWIPKGKRTIDHIWPIAKGGSDAEWNLCCSCGSCNSSKRARDPEEFSGQYELSLVPRAITI